MPENRRDRQLWQDEVVKLGGAQLLVVLEEIRDGQERTCVKIKELERSIGATLQEHIKTAFAGADPAGHRRAHETIIELIEERRKLRVAIQEKTISGLIWAGMIWLGLQVFSGIKHALGIVP